VFCTNLNILLLATLIQAWIGPSGFGRLRLPEFLDNQHMKVVRLSALRTGSLYPPGDIPGTHFCFFYFDLSKVIFNYKFIKLCPLITKNTVLQLIVISNPLLSILSAIFQNDMNLKSQSYIEFYTISITLDIQV